MSKTSGKKEDRYGGFTATYDPVSGGKCTIVIFDNKVCVELHEHSYGPHMGKDEFEKEANKVLGFYSMSCKEIYAESFKLNKVEETLKQLKGMNEFLETLDTGDLVFPSLVKEMIEFNTKYIRENDANKR